MLKWFIVIIINAVLILQTKSESSSCELIHFEGEKTTCFLQRGTLDVDKISPYLLIRYNISYNGDENCTITFWPGFSLKNLYIIKNHSQLETNDSLDVLEIKANEHDEIPLRIEASLSPCQLSEDHILVVRGDLNEYECRNCEIFHSSVIEFEPKHYNFSRWIALSLLNLKLNMPLKVEILTSSSCNITCEYGSTFDCIDKPPTPLSIQIHNKWNLIDNNGLRTLHINASEPGYYCVRIYLPRYCCPLCSQTLFFKEKYKFNISSRTYKEEKIMGHGLLFLGIWLGNIVLISLAFYVCFSGKILVKWKKNAGSDAHYDSLSVLNVEVGHHNSTETSEILLLYIKESSELLVPIKKLKNVLKMFFSQVLDPFECECVDEATENYSFWIDRLLKCDATKVIIVSPISSLDSPIRKEHPFDIIFRYAVSTISHDPLFAHNYRRLFVIQFDPFPTSPALMNIVPCTRYQMPDHFQELIKDITGLNDLKFSIEMLKRKEDFKSALRSYTEKSHDIDEE